MEKRKKLYRLAVGLSAIILSLTGRPQAIVISFGLILLWTLIGDREILRRVGRWKFWLFTVLVTLLAGILLGSNPKPYFGIPISIEGVIAGIYMNLRAFSLVVATVLIAKSITRERFMKTSGKLGMSYINPAFATAMDTLPGIKDAWHEAQNKENGSKYHALARLFLWVAGIAKGLNINNQRIFCVTGNRGSGKTGLLHEIAGALEKKSVKVAGILQDRVQNKNGKTVGYEVKRWGTEDSVTIAEGKSGVGYSFNEKGFIKSEEWLKSDTESASFVIIDELGLLEANGQGHAKAIISTLEANKHAIFLMTLRKDKRNAIAAIFDLKKENILDLDSSREDITLFSERIFGCVKKV